MKRGVGILLLIVAFFPVLFFSIAFVSAAVCGNNVVETGEQCDGSSLGSLNSCTKFGLYDGTLRCNNCKYNTSECLQSPPSGETGGTQNTIPCTDSDNGKNYNTRGTIVYGSNTFTDRCGSTTQVFEYFCPAAGSTVIVDYHTCEIGCSDGVCITNAAASYVFPTENSGAVKARNYIEINVTSTYEPLDKIIIRLYNSSRDAINSSIMSTSPNFVNFTDLDDGLYFYDATARDTFGNFTNLETRNITLSFEIPETEGTPTETPEETQPVCGNGITETGEQCDDENTENGDGCSSTCQTEETSQESNNVVENVVSDVVNVVSDAVQTVIQAVASIFTGGGGESISLIDPRTGEEISGTASEIRGILSVDHLDDFENNITYDSYRLTDDNGNNYFLEINDSNNSLSQYEGVEMSIRGIKSDVDNYISDFTGIDSELITNESLVQLKESPIARIYSTESDNAQMAPSAPNIGSAINKKVAVIIVITHGAPNILTKYDLEKMMFTDSNSVRNFYLENSYGNLDISGDVFDPIHVYKDSCGALTGVPDVPFIEAKWSEIADNADNQLRDKGVNLDDYDYKIYVINDPNCRSFAFPMEGRTWIYGNSERVIIHELGHLLGIGAHANGGFCGVYQTVDAGIGCAGVEYMDYMDIMGVGDIYYADGGRHFNFAHKLLLNWVTTSNAEIASDNPDWLDGIASNGVYNIYPIEDTPSSSKPQAVIIPAQIPAYPFKIPYFVDYRRPVGFDAGLKSGTYTGVSILRDFGDATFLYDSIPSKDVPRSSVHSNFPLGGQFVSQSVWNAFEDTSLLDGGSFYDLKNKITITQISHNEEYATINVEYGDINCIRKNPSAEVVELSPYRYKVMILNNDPPTCGDSRNFQIEYPKDSVVHYDINQQDISILAGSGISIIFDPPMLTNSITTKISDNTGWTKEIEKQTHYQNQFFMANTSLFKIEYKTEPWNGCRGSTTSVCTNHPDVINQYFKDNPNCSPNLNCGNWFSSCNKDICPKPVSPGSNGKFGTKIIAHIGEYITLNWTKIGNPISCWAYDRNVNLQDSPLWSWNGPKSSEGGSETFGPFSEQTNPNLPFEPSLRCNYLDGGFSLNSVQIKVERSQTPPIVTLDFAATDSPKVTVEMSPPNGMRINEPGHTILLNWSVYDGDSCVASGDWSGTKANSSLETEKVGPLRERRKYEYTLTCSNPYGSTSSTFFVNVGPPDTTPPTVSVNEISVGDSPGFSITCSDTGGCNENSYKYLISDSEISNCPTNLGDYSFYTTPVAVQQGQWVCGYVEDTDGNGAFSQPKKIIIDAVPPTISINYELHNLLGFKWVTATTTCTDENGGSGCNENSFHYKRVRIGTSAEQLAAECQDISTYSEGSSFAGANLVGLGWDSFACAYAEDNAGNRGITSIQFVGEGEQQQQQTAPICGNNVVEGTEVCDGADLNGQICATRGYDSGILSCLSDCSGFDESRCIITSSGGSTGGGNEEGRQMQT